MRSLGTIFLLASLLVVVACGRMIAMPEAPSTTSQMPQTPQPAPEKVFQNLKSESKGFQIGVSVHEIGTGPNKTVWNVAYSENTLTSPSSFGLIQVVDNIMTSDPRLDSLPLARVQGTVTFADLRETALSVNLNFIFTEEIYYGGNTLNVQGRLLLYKESQLAVVGGSGTFETAHGVAFGWSRSFDPSTLHRVYTYVFFFRTN